MREEKKMIIDLIVTIVLVSVGCYVGKLLMDKYDTWISFNGPAIGILVIGELIWWGIKKIRNKG